MLDPLEPVLRELIAEWPEIKAPRVTELLRDEHGYQGSVDLVRKRLATIRPRKERPAQRTGYRPAQVMQVDWAEMPTRPKIDGAERRVYALICSLPYSGASTAHFSFDLTAESDVHQTLTLRGGTLQGATLWSWQPRPWPWLRASSSTRPLTTC